MTSPGPKIGAAMGDVIVAKGDDNAFVGVSGIASACWYRQTFFINYAIYIVEWIDSTYIVQMW